jgi:outer membrane protein assembly factor BamA
LNNYYDAEEIAGDVTKLEKVYSKRGFLDTKIENKVSFNETKSKVYVEFNIVEGQIYNVESIKFSGNKYFNEEEHDFRLSNSSDFSEGINIGIDNN